MRTNLTASLTAANVTAIKQAWVQIKRDEVVGRFGGWPQGKAHSSFITGTGAVSVVTWRPRKLTLAIDATTNSNLRVHQFYYAGWQGTLDNHTLAVTPTTPEGLLQFSIPAGRHTITLKLAATPRERAGQIISATALLALIALAILERRQFRDSLAPSEGERAGERGL